ncbi:MAG: hypothetical protein RBR71_00595 [Gudongella sp.]|nr:hypothetical protein [Gudongella sp.]
MLIFKDIQDRDMINRFIKTQALAEEFQLAGDYFGCIDGEDLVGLCKIQIKSDRLVLIYIYFKEEYKLLKLESALLKSLLFRFNDFEYNELDSFQKSIILDKLGFREIDGQYKLILKEFLVSNCSCGVSINE